MDYIICEKPGLFDLRQTEVPKRHSDEALLEIKRVGICGTDLHAYAGNQAFFAYPRILGHELAAVILDVDDEAFQPGDKVVVMPYISCKTCVACRRGKTNCCTNIQVLGVHTDGGMQQKIAVPKDLLLPTKNLSYEEMAIVEPLAIAAHAISRAEIAEGERVVVMGCGPIGLGILKLAQIAGAVTIALDKNEQRLQFAKQQLGVAHTIDIGTDAVSQIKEITNGDLANVVFDASGNQKALESGPQYMAHGGRFVLVGLSKGTLTYNHPELHAKEATIMCSRNANLTDFKNAISLLEQKLFPTESFITHSVHYSLMINQFDSWLNPETEVIKAMVEF